MIATKDDVVVEPKRPAPPKAIPSQRACGLGNVKHFDAANRCTKCHRKY